MAQRVGHSKASHHAKRRGEITSCCGRCEMYTPCSRISTLGPHLVTLFGEVVNLLDCGTLLQEVSHGALYVLVPLCFLCVEQCAQSPNSAAMIGPKLLIV